MRSEDGKHFENVFRVTDCDRDTGEEFVADQLDFPGPVSVGDVVSVGSEKYKYHGENNIGRSIFGPPGEFLGNFLTRSL